MPVIFVGCGSFVLGFALALPIAWIDYLGILSVMYSHVASLSLKARIAQTKRTLVVIQVFSRLCGPKSWFNS